MCKVKFHLDSYTKKRMNAHYNQVGILTGISSGIGFHLSILLSGDNIVYGILRNKNKFLNNLEKYQYKLPENLQIIEMDVRDYTKGKSLVDSIYKEHNKIDFLINNAGYGVYAPYEEISDQEFREEYETNFFAPLQWIRFVLPYMRKQNYGRIFNITSILGRLTIPTSSAYASSKFSLVAISEVLRYELSPFSIQVCSIEPGLIKTDFKNNMVVPSHLDDMNLPYYFLNQLIQKRMFTYPFYAMDAKNAAMKINKLFKKKRIPAHYRVGIDAKLYWFLKNILPENLLIFFIENYIKFVFSKYESKKRN